MYLPLAIYQVCPNNRSFTRSRTNRLCFFHQTQPRLMATNNQQTTIVEVAHDLTPDEQLTLQQRVMGLLDTKQELAAELVSANGEFKRRKADVEKREKDTEAEINRVRGEIKVGREMRKYKCNIIRNRDERRVDYVVVEGPLAGQIIKTHEFTQADWEETLKSSEQEIQFDGVLGDDDDDNEPQDLRAQADLTATGPLQPNRDVNGQVVAGEDTDAYNVATPDSPYRHLSEHIDFEPAIVGGAQEDAAEPTDAADVDPSDLDDEQGDSDEDEEDGDDDSDDDSDDDGDDDDEPQAPTPPAPPKRRAARTKTPAAE